MKILVTLLIVALAIWLWKSRREQPPQSSGNKSSRSPRNGLAAPEPMVRCAACGLHLPRKDAIAGSRSGAGTRYYCCRSHYEQTEASAQAPSQPTHAGRNSDTDNSRR